MLRESLSHLATSTAWQVVVPSVREIFSIRGAPLDSSLACITTKPGNITSPYPNPLLDYKVQLSKNFFNVTSFFCNKIIFEDLINRFKKYIVKLTEGDISTLFWQPINLFYILPILKSKKKVLTNPQLKT